MIVEWIYALVVLAALFAAIMVVVSPHPVRQALWLVMTMIAIATLFVLMNAQLAAAFQVIVYAGAIMVLFLFVSMLLNLRSLEAAPVRTRSVRWIGLLLAIAFAVQVVAMLAGVQKTDALAAAPVEAAKIDTLARLLITDYIYAFEMTSILLLIAVVGAIVLARRRLIQGAPAEKSE